MKPENAPRLEAWMSASEIASFFGVSRTTVNEMIRSGEFKTLHTAGSPTRPSYMVKRSEVEKIAGTRSFPRAKQDEVPDVS